MNRSCTDGVDGVGDADDGEIGPPQVQLSVYGVPFAACLGS